MLQPVERQESECLLSGGTPLAGWGPTRLRGIVTRERIDRRGFALEESVENDLVAFFVGVREVQHERGVGLEPPDLVSSAAARNDGKP